MNPRVQSQLDRVLDALRNLHALAQEATQVYPGGQKRGQRVVVDGHTWQDVREALREIRRQTAEIQASVARDIDLTVDE